MGRLIMGHLDRNASNRAQSVADSLQELVHGVREAVLVSDGYHLGTTLFRDMQNVGSLHAYIHDGGGALCEGLTNLVLVESTRGGDETGLNKHPGLVACDLGSRKGLWLIEQTDHEGDWPEGVTVVWRQAK